MSIAEKLITAEEFATMPSNGRPCELVRGRIVELNPPSFPHGLYCGNIHFFLRLYLLNNDIGRAVCNDAGVITTRFPDSVRGPDVSYYSYERVPKEELPTPYPDVPPNIAFEVRSPFNRQSDLLEKVAELLAAGVDVVVVIDPQVRRATIYTQGESDVILNENDVLTIPKYLPGFEVRLSDILG